MTAIAALLDGGRRLHLQHGPIDLIVGAEGRDAAARSHAFAAAARCFDGLLEALVAELPLLRAQVAPDTPAPRGPVAARMLAAVRAHSADTFVTPMAAVAGAVADEVLAAMTARVPLSRAYVNNGGDIALHLTGAGRFTAAMAGLDGAGLGRIAIGAGDGIGGMATSGAGGRSLSLGIADSVTALGASAAAADAAATLIANAVDLPGHPGSRRAPARDLDPDSDLGRRPAVVGVPALGASEVDRALAAGAARAGAMLGRGLIAGAALFLQGHARTVGAMPVDRIQSQEAAHA